MAVVTRLAASNRAGSWGPKRDTLKQAEQAALEEGQWSYADSGSLLRIAEAMEKLVVQMAKIGTLLHPLRRGELLAKEKQEVERAREDKEAMLQRSAEVWPAIEQWRARNAKVLAKLPERIHCKLIRAVRITGRDSVTHVWYWDTLRELLALPLADADFERLGGIGKVGASLIAAAIAKAEAE